MRTIYLDGQYLRVNAQTLEPFTPGVFESKGVFETMLGLGGLVMDSALHLKRLRQGLKVLGIKPPSIHPSVLQEVLKRNQLACARVRLMVWRPGKDIHVMAAALPYKIPGKKKYRVCVVKTERPASKRWANVKSLDYGLFAHAFARARKQGFDEALLLNAKGHIFEASRANLFVVKEGTLYTPPLSSGCLNGITRQQVIRKARDLKIKVREEDITPFIIKNADAAFLTNSLAGITPIEIRALSRK